MAPEEARRADSSGQAEQVPSSEEGVVWGHPKAPRTKRLPSLTHNEGSVSARPLLVIALVVLSHGSGVRDSVLTVLDIVDVAVVLLVAEELVRHHPLSAQTKSSIGCPLGIPPKASLWWATSLRVRSDQRRLANMRGSVSA